MSRWSSSCSRARSPKHSTPGARAEDLGEELADLAIYLLSLAEMTGVVLEDEIEAKMAKNAVRVYRPLPNGVLMKSNGAAD
jgi:NTP pyrophosphatase (non-canonical NTP hydrolase)